MRNAEKKSKTARFSQARASTLLAIQIALCGMSAHEIHQNIVIVILIVIIFRLVERFSSNQRPNEFNKTGRGTEIGNGKPWAPARSPRSSSSK
jgi:hypothetical protein